MKKIFTSIFMLSLCTFLTAQSVLNISGTLSNPDGSGAGDIPIALFLSETGETVSIESSEDGSFQFGVDLGEGESQGCFEMFLFDCDLSPILISDCYNPGNYDFNYDIVYCENGTETCFAIVFSEVIDSAYYLNVWEFGVAPYTYLWDDGSTDENLIVPFGEEGEYCVTVTDSQGCESEACLDLTPPSPCFVHIFAEYNYDSVILFAEGYGQTDELDYIWSTGSEEETITITESGEYCVTITDGLGCESFDCGYFEVDSIWYQDCFSYIYSTYEDSIETLNVESFGVAPFTYVWTLGDSVISTTQSYVPTESGVYCVTVVDANGCEFTACYEHFVWEACGVWLSCDPTDAGVQLVAFGYGAEPLEYIWSTGDIGSEIIVTESGEYCVTVTDSEGCSSSACLDVNTDVSECFAPIEIIEFPESAVLTINPVTDGQYEFYWITTGDTTSSITVYESGTYCVEVVEVSTGCSYFTCATVYIGDQPECWGWIEVDYTGDSTAVLTIFAVDVTNDTPTFEIEWSNGEIGESIEVITEGEYCATVTGATGCEFETCIDVVFGDITWTNILFGFVTGSDTAIPLNATVDIYAVNNDGSIELYSEGNETFDGGAFFIENVEEGNYIALATTDDDEYVPTYSLSTTSWEEADVYYLSDFTPPLEIRMIPITTLAGDGSIEGIVTTDNIVANKKEGEVRNGTPVVGANVMLMHSEVPVGQNYTNEEGSFSFTNLPYGTYTVVLEIPGSPRMTYEVTLSADNPNVTDVEFETDTVLSSTDNIAALSSLTLSPNPTYNTLVVSAYFTERKELSYRVLDMNGRIINKSTLKAEVGENEILLDATTLDRGVYNFILQSNEELILKRFIKL